MGASPATTCDGLKKNTRFSLNALSTSQAAVARPQRPRPTIAILLCRAFMSLPAYWCCGADVVAPLPLSPQQEKHLAAHGGQRDRVRGPYVECVTTHGREPRPTHFAPTVLVPSGSLSRIRLR